MKHPIFQVGDAGAAMSEQGTTKDRVCAVCDTPEGDHLDWCTPQARAEQRPSKDQVCKCVPGSWNGTPNAICSGCRPDPIAPEYCMHCEHDVACHDQFGEVDPIVYEQMTRAGVTT